MPESRKRSGHPYRKPSDISARQRTSGRVVWAILIAVFALILIYFNTTSLVLISTVTAAGGIVGYFIGKKLEAEARK